MSRTTPSFLTKNIFDHGAYLAPCTTVDTHLFVVISDLLREREESGETFLYEDEFLADCE